MGRSGGKIISLLSQIPFNCCCLSGGKKVDGPQLKHIKTPEYCDVAYS